MSLDISYYRKINNFYNATETVSKKESEIYSLKQHMSNTFSDSLDYQDDTLRNGINQRFVISYYKDADKKKITAFPNEILNIGDLIDCFGSKWLTIYINSDKTVYTKGIIQQCNYLLPYQITNSTIYTAPCIVTDATKYSDGEKSGRIITTQDTQKQVLIQYNQNTAKIKKGKRIFLDMVCDDMSVFKITDIDRITYMNDGKGLWLLRCSQERIGVNDRQDLMIADYIPDAPLQPSTPSSVGSCEITFKTKPEVKYGGNGKTFIAVFKDTIGVVLTKNTPVWTLDLPSECIGKITIKEQKEKYIVINCINDSSLNGKKFTIKLTDMKNTCYASQEVKVVSPI